MSTTIDASMFNNYNCTQNDWDWFNYIINNIYSGDQPTIDAYKDYYIANICSGINQFAVPDPSVTLPASSLPSNCTNYKPTSVVNYDDSDINTISYNFNKFDDVIKYSQKFIVDSFASELNKNLQDKTFCRQSTILSSTTNVFIPPDVTLVNCTIDVNINQRIGGGLGVETDNFCVNINERLKYMTNADRNNLFDRSIDKLKTSLISKTEFENRKNFIDQLVILLKNNINTTPSNSNTTCSQQTLIKKYQSVTIIPPGGIMKCNGCSKLTINNDAFIKPYMNCVVEPVWTNVSNNPMLQRMFTEGDRSSCVYQQVQLTACQPSTKKYRAKIEILKPSNLGNPPDNRYECKYQDGDTIEVDCTIPECEVSPWSEWSVCNIQLGSNKGRQTRERKYVKSGEGCSGLVMKEERECELSREQLATVTRYAGEYSQAESKLNNINDTNNWIYLMIGQKIGGNSQVIYLSLLLFLIIIILIFILK
jgi:hypothetical protein